MANVSRLMLQACLCGHGGIKLAICWQSRWLWGRSFSWKCRRT